MSEEARQDNVIDLLNLIEGHLQPQSILESIKYADIILLLSYSRTEQETFGTYKSLLEQLGTLLGPYFAQHKDFSANLFATDLSKLKLNQLQAFVEKRLSLYEPNEVETIEDLLAQA